MQTCSDMHVQAGLSGVTMVKRFERAADAAQANEQEKLDA